MEVSLKEVETLTTRKNFLFLCSFEYISDNTSIIFSAGNDKLSPLTKNFAFFDLKPNLVSC